MLKQGQTNCNRKGQSVPECWNTDEPCATEGAETYTQRYWSWDEASEMEQGRHAKIPSIPLQRKNDLWTKASVYILLPDQMGTRYKPAQVKAFLQNLSTFVQRID